MILGPILVYFLSVFQSIFNDFGINFEAKFKIIFVCYRLCYLHLFPYLFIFVFCSIFSYYVSSVFCERSAQASEASVAREAIQTHAQFCPILKHVFVFVFLCVLLSVYLFLSGIFVLLCICRVYSSTRVFKLQLIRASRSFVSQVFKNSNSAWEVLTFSAPRGTLIGHRFWIDFGSSFDRSLINFWIDF